MARFESPTFGKISGKHGTAVAAVRKDGTCIRKVYRVASNPNTQGQKNQRGKFGFVMKELNCMRKLFTETFGGQYGINKAVAQAMKNCVSGDSECFSFEYSKLQLTTGNLDAPANINISKISAQKIKLQWDTTEFTQSAGADNLNLVLVNNPSKYMDFHKNIATRNNGLVEIELQKFAPNSETHGWLFFTSVDGKRYSESRYIGLI
jgi:hypothetical protein